MKKVVFILLLLTSVTSFAQGYLSDNEVTLTATQGKKIFNWYSSKMTTMLDLERSEMNLHIESINFISEKDSLRKIILASANCPSIHLALTLPFNKLDKDISGRQVFLLTGVLSSCGSNYPVNVNVGFQFQDKLLMFDFRLKAEASVLGITGLKGIDPIVMLHTDSGKILLRQAD